MVTVVLTTYNRPELLIRAFESILDQTYKPKQIIVVDDCSDQNTSDIIKNYLPGNVNYIKHNKNRGLAAARNTGLYESSEKLVAYLDDDDVWLPGRLEAQIKLWESLDRETKKKIACIQVGGEIIDSKNNLLDVYLPFNEGNLKDSIINFGTGTISSCFLFIKEKLVEVGGFDEHLISGIDDDIWMSLATSGYSNIIISNPFVQIIRENNIGMMSSTNRRIKGLSQYLQKWSPTIIDWLGEYEGKQYLDKYFITSVGMLAGEKIAVGNFRSANFALTKIIKFIGIHNYPKIFFTFYFIAKVFIGIRFPKFAKLMKKIILFKCIRK